MTLPPLLTIAYWFKTLPTPMMSIALMVLVGVFAALFLMGVIAQLAKMRGGLDKLVRRAVGLAGTGLMLTGSSGLLLCLFEYERIQFLSMRVWFIVWFAWFCLWIWRVYKYAMIEIPAMEKRREEREQHDKWLPKKK